MRAVSYIPGLVVTALLTSKYTFTGKKRRLTFIECSNDISTMIDLAKVADLVSMCLSERGGECECV